jgi:hypothetical protein
MCDKGEIMTSHWRASSEPIITQTIEVNVSHGTNQNHEPQEGTPCQWLTPVIPATQEAEIRRILVQSQPGQIILEILS